MKHRNIFLSLFLVMTLLLAGCGDHSSTKENESSTGHSSDNTDSANTNAFAPIMEADMFSNRDKDASYNESDCVIINLNGDSASCSSDAVKISGTTISILDEGTFLLTGTLSDGMLVVNAKKDSKPQIVLKNASITSKTSAPLYILEADKVFVTLADGSTNTLENGGTFTAIDDNNIDGAVFSKQDLTFNGTGKLNISSPFGHGIVCKDDLVLTDGTYTISSASHAIDANDSVRITKATLTLEAGKDGIHSENSDDAGLGFIYIADGTLNVTAEGDGISANAYMTIADGSFDIISGGGSENGTKESSDNWGGFPGDMGGGHGGGPGGKRPGARTNTTELSTTDSSDDSSTSLKAIKAGGDLLIRNGKFTINSADDAIHSNASVTINGGTYKLKTGDDGFHADDTLSVTSGTIEITESYEGLEAEHIKVSGGDIKLVASDDGLNASGGTDSSGTTGGRDAMFGGGRGGMGGPGGMSSSSNGSILISGGNLSVNASGDGLDANGTLEITGGYTVVVGPTQGDTATLDYDKTATISGGTFIGTGAAGMAQTFSDSEQGVFAVSVGNQSAGTNIVLKDAKGNTIISYAPELNFAVVILSSPDIKKGETYTITVGETSGEFEAN